MRGPVFRLSEAFGAWRVIDRGGERVYDFAPLQGDSIEDDLRRRDFTVNAMARPVAPDELGGRRADGDLIDPLGGRADLEARTLRVLGPEAYESDPLRAAAPGALRRRARLRRRTPRPSGSPASTPRASPRPPASACSPSCGAW